MVAFRGPEAHGDSQRSIHHPTTQRDGSSNNPIARLHVLWTLSGLGNNDLEVVKSSLKDSDPRVRSAAIRLSEKHIAKDKSLKSLLVIENERDPRVVLQVRNSLRKVGLTKDADALVIKKGDQFPPRSSGPSRKRKIQENQKRRAQMAKVNDKQKAKSNAEWLQALPVTLSRMSCRKCFRSKIW